MKIPPKKTIINYFHNDKLHAVIDLINSGRFSKGDQRLFSPITDKLIWDEPFMLMAELMAREDLSPGSRHIYFQMFPDNIPKYRQVKDGEMKAIYPARSVGEGFISAGLRIHYY